MIVEPPGLDSSVSAIARGPRVARAELGFVRGSDDATFLARQYAEYPFHLCRPFWIDGDPPGLATLYLQSCSGGLFRGDRVDLSIVVEESAEAHVTTQAATIVHDGEGEWTEQRTQIEARPGSFLEYLPDPLILFPGARLSTTVRARLHEGATLVVADGFLQHDPFGTGRTFDRLTSELSVETTAGSLLALDRFAIDGRELAMGQPGVMGRYRAHASMIVVGGAVAGEALVAALRTAIGGVPGLYGGASSLPAGVGTWSRMLARDAVALRAGMAAAWSAVRTVLRGSPPPPRRK